MSFTRYAVYHLPEDPALADFGARWLGWDVTRATQNVQPDLSGIRDITEAPRKYGFHGTLKPPFMLAPGEDVAALDEAVAQIAQTTASTRCAGLELRRLGRFLALVPQGETTGLSRIAARLVEALDPFRAPSSAADLEKRRKAGLTARQDALLTRWGYPYVMEEFRFHLTLTGRLPKDEIDGWMRHAAAALPVLPEPFAVTTISLVGERAEDGRFQKLQDYTLTG